MADNRVTQIPGVVDLSAGNQTVSASPAIVSGVAVNVSLNAYSVDICNGSTVIRTIPASALAGTQYDLDNAEFDTSLVVKPHGSSTGKIVITYRPLVIS